MTNTRRAWARRVGVVEPAPHKYGAKPVTVDGIRFASTKESRRYKELCLLQRAGAIKELEMQPLFPIVVRSLYVPDAPPVHVGSYRADFRYIDTSTGATVIEDVKHAETRTTAYRLRKRLVEAIHGIQIREV